MLGKRRVLLALPALVCAAGRLSAQGPEQAPADRSKIPLVWSQPCQFTYADKARTHYEESIPQYVCDYENLNKNQVQTFNNADRDLQNRILAHAKSGAATMLQYYERAKAEMLLKTDPKKPPPDVKKGKGLQSWLEKLPQDVEKYKTKLKEDNLVVKGADKRGDKSYFKPYDARIAEIKLEIRKAKGEKIKEVSERSKKGFAKQKARLADKPGNKSVIGRTSRIVKQRKNPNENLAATLVGEGGRRSKKIPGRSGRVQPVQLSNSAREAGRRDFGKPSITLKPDSVAVPNPVTQSGKPAAKANHAKPEEKEGLWPKRQFRQAEEYWTDAGTNRLVKANAHSDAADKALREADKACQQGSTLQCLKAKAAGYKDYAKHKVAAAGNTGAALGDAWCGGVSRGMQNKGPEAHLLKAAAVVSTFGYGVVAAEAAAAASATAAANAAAASTAANAAVATSISAGTAASAETALVAAEAAEVAAAGAHAAAATAAATTVGGAAKAGVIAYGVTSGVQRIGGADTVGQAAVGGVEIAASLGAPAMERAGEAAIVKAAEAMPTVAKGVGVAGRWVASTTSSMLPRIGGIVEAATFGKVTSGALTATVEGGEKLTEEWGKKVVIKKAGDYVLFPVEQGAQYAAGKL